jgi:hypothetical protein
VDANENWSAAGDPGALGGYFAGGALLDVPTTAPCCASLAGGVGGTEGDGTGTGAEVASAGFARSGAAVRCGEELTKGWGPLGSGVVGAATGLLLGVMGALLLAGTLLLCAAVLPAGAGWIRGGNCTTVVLPGGEPGGLVSTAAPPVLADSAAAGVMLS